MNTTARNDISISQKNRKKSECRDQKLLALSVLIASTLAMEEEAYADTTVDVPGKRKHVITVDKEAGQSIVIKDSPKHGSVEVDQEKGTITYISDAEKDSPPPDSYIYDLTDDSSSALWLLGLAAIALLAGAAGGSGSNGGGEEPVAQFDFGDLPETSSMLGDSNLDVSALQSETGMPINTLLENDGPRHEFTEDSPLFFFSQSAQGPSEGAPDAEVDGQPSDQANGDDLTGIDDEADTDFTIVTFGDDTLPQLEFNVSNATAEDAYVSVWIDINDNQLWDVDESPFEFVIQAHILPAGFVGTLQVDVDTQSEVGIESLALFLSMNDSAEVAARARVSTDKDAMMSPDGYAPDGEVEDFFVDITNLVFIDDGLI